MRRSIVVTALPLALGALALGVSGASANQTGTWGDNGSGTCSTAESWFDADIPELGVQCMQSVTGWISIGALAGQTQAISCSNNAPGGSPGLSWSVYNNSYVNDGPWTSLPVNSGTGVSSGFGESGWQTGNGGSAYLISYPYAGATVEGNAGTSPVQYGSTAGVVDNTGGNGYWQLATACLNSAGVTAQTTYATTGQAGNELHPGRAAKAANGLVVTAPAPASYSPRDKTIDAVDHARHRAFLAREYVLKRNVTRTDTRTCPTGMARTGKLAYTLQEFPADHRAPKWRNRSLVDVTMTPVGLRRAKVSMTLTRATNPTVVQFQMHCAKG